MTRSLAGFAGGAAAVLMIALIAAVSLTGRWPTDAPIEVPSRHGILALPESRVAHVEIAGAGNSISFDRGSSGAWLVGAIPIEHAIGAHLDTALHMLNISEPRRTFVPSDYDAGKLAEFGLDPPDMLISLVQTNGKTTRIGLGAATPAQNSQYVRVLGTKEVHLLAGYVGAEWRLALDMALRSRAPASDESARSRAYLLPVSIAQAWAIEIVANGALVRFERDPAGDWFHHVGHHVHVQGGFVHKADPKFAVLIKAELDALERAPVEDVLDRHPDESMLDNAGLEHPSAILVMYSRDSSDPVARIAFGNTAEDGFHRYALVRESDSLVTVASYEAAHVGNLLRIAGAPQK